MSIFNNIFNKNKEEETDQSGSVWLELNSIEMIDSIKNTKEDEYFIIFKHSTRCSISRSVLRKFESKLIGKEIKAYKLDLLNYRSLSSHIADIFSIEHQSPQLIVINKGDVVYSNSHYDILDFNWEDNIK
ncbi:MAG: bacillithiol system redox-active protein YtxJ [Flavobacteriaceae bacterium]|nr:bacillithiol system redox-active protein YtxJ [Flavobacteriaceae bacterium]